MKKALETVEGLARGAKAEELTDFLLALDASTRDELKPRVRKLVNKARRDETFYTPAETKEEQWSGRFGLGHQKAFQTARLAALATLDLSDLKKLQWTDSGDPQFWIPGWEPWRIQMLRILETLKPAWIQEFADFLLIQQFNHWFFVRALIRRSLCKVPKISQYTFGMASEMRNRWSTSYMNDEVLKKPVPPGEFFKNKLESLGDALLADPEMLN